MKGWLKKCEGTFIDGPSISFLSIFILMYLRFYVSDPRGTSSSVWRCLLTIPTLVPEWNFSKTFETSLLNFLSVKFSIWNRITVETNLREFQFLKVHTYTDIHQMSKLQTMIEHTMDRSISYSFFTDFGPSITENNW